MAFGLRRRGRVETPGDGHPEREKFDLQDASGTVLVDATQAELDLPQSPVRQVRSGTSVRSSVSSVPTQVPAATAGTPATDAELLQYIEQARLQQIGRMVGKGIGLIARAIDPSHEPRRQPFLNALANPGGSGAQMFKNQMIKMMVARKDPTGENTRLALEVWKYPQGSPQFESALVRFAQAYSRAMAPGKPVPDATAALTNFRLHPQTLTMVALVAGTAEPQADPEIEKARQAAIAFGRHDPTGAARIRTHQSTGHFRLTEYCLVPGQTYNITGTCTENPNPRHARDRNIIVMGTNEPTFLISSKSEKQVESGLRKRIAWMILGGGAVAVVCLAILLGKMGLL